MKPFREKSIQQSFLRSNLLSVGWGFLLLSSTAGAAALNSCDLNSDGVVNSLDVNLAADMNVGAATCTANIVGPGVCNVVMVQRVVNATLPGGACNAHSVLLTWTASDSPNIAGYKIYRRTTPDGIFTQVNSTLNSGLSYIDSLVQGDQTYYYVLTAVDTSGNESDASVQVTAAVPSS